MRRRLSLEFIACLRSGFLTGLTEAVRPDKDLNLEIRENYLNIYFKGNSLLRLAEASPNRYLVSIDSRFTQGLTIPAALVDESSTAQFVGAIPHLKTNIGRYGRRSIELEYEQLIIRANNHETRNNSDYFIIDRQYVMPQGRFDLLGIYWARSGRHKGQSVPLCLFEVKFGLNNEIATLAEQLKRYHAALVPRLDKLAEEMEILFHQKLALGAYRLPAYRVAAMETLHISPDPTKVQYVVLLVDNNPNSGLLKLPELQGLRFASQIRLMRTGFAMWQQNVQALTTEAA